ncbi:MAG TPA: glycine zipper domain-containing protein [Caulobacteraceae bacterium]|nr:glycine zipper domain-containing protein [Caulobacteraceae bacterium]
MRTQVFLAGLSVAVALPAAVLAQPYDSGCVRANHDNHVAGTIVGGVTGAILGSAIAGRHDRGAGAVVGAGVGAVAGNAISRSNDHPCPEGYVYEPRGADYGPDHGARFWAGAPTGIHERISFMQDRIDRASADGSISRAETRYAYRELNYIRSEDDRLRYQDGGRLRPEDRDYLQGRLNSLGERLHWAERVG